MSNLAELLAAVRELRTALKHPIPYPGRPGKTCIDLADDRAEHIRAVLFHAAHKTPGSLPHQAATYVRDLLDDFENIRFRPCEDPSGIHRRAINWVREIQKGTIEEGTIDVSILTAAEIDRLFS